MKSALKKTLLLAAIAAGIYVAIIAATMQATRLNQRNLAQLTEHWTVEIEDERYEDVSYERFAGDENRLKSGDVVVYTRTLGNMGNPAFPTIYMHTRKSATQVYLDDVLLQESDMDRVEDGRFVGRRVRFISLPQDYAGRELKFVFYISRDGSGIGYDAPRFGGYKECFMYYVQRSAPVLLAGTLLLLFGFIFLFISMFFISSEGGQGGEAISSLVCIVFGVWLLGYFDLTRVFLFDGHSTVVEYLMMYLMAPLFLLLMGRLYPNARALKYAGYGALAAVALVAASHNTGVMPIDAFAAPYQAMLLISLVWILTVLMRRRIRSTGELDLNVQEMGIVMLCGFMLLYLITYVVQNMLGVSENAFTMYLPVIGTTTFVVSQILYYFIHVSEAYARRRDFSALSHLAYVDVLTGLPNRKAAMNIFSNMDSTSGAYCILSLDLNGLKGVNDQYGHHEGDRLLKATADALNECFGDVGFRARLSGDEFLVVVRHATKELTEERLARLRTYCETWRADKTNVDCSIACGYAFRGEEGAERAEEVYRLADERMYADKSAHYEEIGKPRR